MPPESRSIPIISVIRTRLGVDIDTLIVLESWIERELEAHRARVQNINARGKLRPEHLDRAMQAIREHLAVVMKHVARLGFTLDEDATLRLIGSVGRGAVSPLDAAKEILTACASATYQKRGAAWVDRGARPRAVSRVKPPKIVVVAAG